MFKQILIFLCSLLMFLSCSTPDSFKTKEKESISHGDEVKDKKEITQQDSIQEIAPWANKLISEYISYYKDKHNAVVGYPISYIKENGIRDGESYIIVKIEHNYEHRFATNQWLYIHEERKQIYEYDLPNDSLILWEP